MPVRRHPVAVPTRGAPMHAFPLDRELIARLKSTYERVREPEGVLAATFYAKLFDAAPHLRPLFRDDAASQARKLTAALDAVVRNLERPADNAVLLADLGRRHAQYGAKPEHYDLVIELLIQSMRKLLGDADPRGLDDWRMALRLISAQMIQAANEPRETGPSRDAAR